jgi:hypothetical protein
VCEYPQWIKLVGYELSPSAPYPYGSLATPGSTVVALVTLLGLARLIHHLNVAPHDDAVQAFSCTCRGTAQPVASRERGAWNCTKGSGGLRARAVRKQREGHHITVAGVQCRLD